MKVRPAEAGFSLIETLVSLAVIAAMTGLLFEAISVNASAAQGVVRRREAVMLAQSLLAEAAIPPGPGALAESGRRDGFIWHVRRRTANGEARASGVPLVEIRIDVADQASGRRLLSVKTLRLSQ